jgi:hypothetical protein
VNDALIFFDVFHLVFELSGLLLDFVLPHLMMLLIHFSGISLDGNVIIELRGVNSLWFGYLFCVLIKSVSFTLSGFPCILLFLFSLGSIHLLLEELRVSLPLGTKLEHINVLNSTIEFTQVNSRLIWSVS